MEREALRNELREKLAGAEKVLIGIGSEWRGGTKERPAEVKAAVSALKNMTAGKDYFVITTLTGEDLLPLNFEKGHMAAPLDVSLTEERWEDYMKWLSFTLNRKTVILELGEDFSHPTLIRWPFEKTAALNQKAFLYRVQEKFYQISDEIKEKARAVACDSVKFILECGENAL